MTSRTLARKLAKVIVDHKGQDIVVLDFRKHSGFTDFFVICSGTSDRHVKAITDALDEELIKLKEKPIGREGYSLGHWSVLDYGNVVVHIFHALERKYYRLDQLWYDIPRISFKDITV